MRTAIRRLIETEMTFGSPSTLAERLEKSLIERIDSYCNAYKESSAILEERWATSAIQAIQGGIIGADPDSLPNPPPKGAA